ncbi:hypothetical protein Nepgr_015425 [Nepenthes gracilis]|uniref:Serine carboxypeptidase-like 18 n=1 Tax=Nepenthes gracilis TaxID=150966 RepID=A0AAD3SMV4_NEPGR|nr:hypothetical protein Nepgr_015425 [Nepenthes gracilis]
MESALPLLLVVLLSAQLAFCGQLVEYLPGYPGKLPFKLETGYIQVGASEMFYYFIESQGDPRTDPLFLWLTGGPGCSSLSGILYEIGPIEFDIDSYLGGIPPLKYYPYAWTKTASIVFLDSPVGTGFSYSVTQEGWVSSDTKAAKEAYEFFLKWLDENRQYLGLQIFVGGDSYSGIIVPLVTKHIVEGNEAGVIPFVNLKGYLLGSPRTDSVLDENSKIKFAHRMALISDEIYDAAKTSCNENYVDVDPTNTACMLALQQYQKCVKDVWTNDILEPNCVFASTRPHETWRSTRSLEEDGNFILSPPKIPSLWCRAFNYALADVWANDGTVRDALHIRKGTIEPWKRCNLTISYTKDQLSVVYAHRFLSNKSLLVLVESGDRDMVVPFVGTVEWIKSLNLTIDIDWHPWFVDGQVAGYTRKYKYSDDTYRLVYATVKGGGHTAPEYYRKRCYFMFDRWVHWYPL